MKNEIEFFLTKLYGFYLTQHRIINKDELYCYIQRLGINDFNKLDENLFYDICDYPEIYVSNYEENCELKGLENDLYYYFSNEEPYRRIEVWYKNTVKKGNRDCIKLYIPLQGEDLVKGSKKIFKYLFKNKIGFISKISKKKRLDGFIIRLFNKKDAVNLCDYCKSENLIYDNLLKLNPFIPTVNKIGVVKDTYGVSYNYTLCGLLIKYCAKNVDLNDNSIFTMEHFYSFVKSFKINNLNKNEDFVESVVIDNIISIIDNRKIFDYHDKYDIKFNYNDYLKYEYSDNCFLSFKEVINSDNAIKYIYLKAQRCMYLLYVYKIGKDVKNYVLNEKISSCFSYIVDKLNDGESFYFNCTINDEILSEIPYLITYFCIKNRHFDIYKSIEILHLIQNKITKK